MNFRISVAIATYHGEKYIQEQLESILNQSKKVNEIIVYDDCSTDATLALLKTYQILKNVEIKVFSQKERVGYVKNFASAMKETTGDIIFLCDQDDIWEVTKVEDMVNLFHQYNRLQCVVSAFTYIDKEGAMIDLEDKGNNHDLCWNTYEKDTLNFISANEILYHNISMGCTMAFRSCIKDEYLHTSEFVAAHDWELFFLATLKNCAGFYNKSLLKYRIHDDNTTGNDKIGKKNHIYANEREKNAKALYDFICSMSVYKSEMSKQQKIKVDKLIKFHKIRKDVVCEGRFFKWFYLVKHYQMYRKIVSNKGVLTDLLYAIYK